MLPLCGAQNCIWTKKLENVQTFALRVCTKQWSLSYEDLIEKINVNFLHELSTRRKLMSSWSLSLLHKVINEECILPKINIILLYHPSQLPLLASLRTFQWSKQICAAFCMHKINVLQVHFSTIPSHNGMFYLTSATSIASFKSIIHHTSTHIIDHIVIHYYNTIVSHIIFLSFALL